MHYCIPVQIEGGREREEMMVLLFMVCKVLVFDIFNSDMYDKSIPC